MSTYAGETATNLKQCLESITQQTILPRELVLVIDGPIDAGQEAVIAELATSSIRLTLIRRERSGGLAVALNDGLKACSCSLAMRMDSDDVCAPDRVAIQAAYASAHPEVDVVASWAEDFYADGRRSQMKISPTEHADILAALRWRNVIVHPSVLIRTKALREIGGYRSKFGMLEDYDLYVRLAMAGAKFHVIPKVLMQVRASLQQRARRGGFPYLLREIGFRAECRRIGFMTNAEFIVITTLYGVFRIASGAMRSQLYALVRT
ncbi:glycosyltransferase [Beijerinckia sp. L45]|uniref:glycosyltransferase n=1 Tax=Beijerinckia sp. L45 TaxID=1641855 RepID=UPI00131E8BA9|nr:glycosyltransferase [Beijerinckia sp. L45]